MEKCVFGRDRYKPVIYCQCVKRLSAEVNDINIETENWRYRFWLISSFLFSLPQMDFRRFFPVFVCLFMTFLNDRNQNIITKNSKKKFRSLPKKKRFSVQKCT